jgi:hypothetical protein
MLGFAFGSPFPYGWLAVRLDFTELDFNAALTDRSEKPLFQSRPPSNNERDDYENPAL